MSTYSAVAGMDVSQEPAFGFDAVLMRFLDDYAWGHNFRLRHLLLWCKPDRMGKEWNDPRGSSRRYGYAPDVDPAIFR
jgi:hypothetical protein